VVDVPLVADYVASILAALAQASAIENLSFTLHLPDENNFSLSMNQFSLIVKVTHTRTHSLSVTPSTTQQAATYLRTLLEGDDEAAKKFFLASVEAPSVSELSRMNKELVEKAIEKSHATFLVSSPLSLVSTLSDHCLSVSVTYRSN
jgi:hypothetical protein